MNTNQDLSSEEIRRRITTVYSLLVSDLDAARLSDFLIEFGIITAHQWYEIENKKSSKHERCRELLSVLMRMTNPSVWTTLWKILTQNDEWSSILDEIKRRTTDPISNVFEGDVQSKKRMRRNLEIDECRNQPERRNHCENAEELQDQKSIIDRHGEIITDLRQKLQRMDSEIKKGEEKVQELQTENKSLTDKCQQHEIRLKELEEQFNIRDDKPWRSNLRLVQTIKGEGNEQISGIVIAGQELLIANSHTAEIKVYDLHALTYRRNFTICGVENHPHDFAFCETNNCLYIMATDRLTRSSKIISSTTNGEILHSWSTALFDGHISVAFDSNIVLTSTEKSFVAEYTPQGEIVRKIQLSKKAGLVNPTHAIKLRGDRFLVSHAWHTGSLHRVCVVDLKGNVKVAFGGKYGADIESLYYPSHMAIDSNGSIIVTDRLNGRLLLFDSKLQFNRVLISEEMKGMEGAYYPNFVAVDNSAGRLFVVHGLLTTIKSDLSVFKFD